MFKNKIEKTKNNRPIISIDFNETKKIPTWRNLNHYIKILKKNTKNILSKKIKNIVITIPAYFA